MEWTLFQVSITGEGCPHAVRRQGNLGLGETDLAALPWCEVIVQLGGFLSTYFHASQHLMNNLVIAVDTIASAWVFHVSRSNYPSNDIEGSFQQMCWKEADV